jgi:hypothetical protein
LQDSVAVFIEEAEDPKINEFQIVVYCVLNQVAVISETEVLGEVEKMKKSLYDGGVHNALVTA